MSYQKCPVCEGRGEVPMGFYLGQTAGTSMSPQQCRSCHGTGTVGFSDFRLPPPIIPMGKIFKMPELG